MLEKAKEQINQYASINMKDAYHELVVAVFMAKASAFIDGLLLADVLTDKEEAILVDYIHSKSKLL